MKFKVELIVNFDESSGKFKIETNTVSLIDTVEPQDGPIATLESNRVVFNKEALKLLNISEGNRLNINYVVLSDGLLHPVIDIGEGNKVTKTGTISCRGTANEVLAQYGKQFIIEKIDNKFILTDSSFKKLIREEDPNITLPSTEEEVDMGSSSSADDILDELDETTPKYKDFFDSDGVDTELKDIDFMSLIE